MATYYRWQKYALDFSESTRIDGNVFITCPEKKLYYNRSKPEISSDGKYVFSEEMDLTEIIASGGTQGLAGWYCSNSKRSEVMYHSDDGLNASTSIDSTQVKLNSKFGYVTTYSISASAGDSLGYVYSLSSSAYPNEGRSGNYYYGKRSQISSPSLPAAITYPDIIRSDSVNVTWEAANSYVPEYPVKDYQLMYDINQAGVWKVAEVTSETNYEFKIPPDLDVNTIQFQVRARDTNDQWGYYKTGSISTVVYPPALTAPSLAMQGQNITVNWTAVTGATSYTLRRKADTDDDWVQVYSGSDLTFTETAGTWTSVQYQVQAVFSDGAGGWTTSGNIPVVPASAIVISGSDSDLGTITSDIPYTVSSDTGNDITLIRTVNGVQVASLTVQSGFAYNIPVVDLPTGTGTIVISASVTASSGTVTATRTWTYTKTAMTFPNSAGIGQLSQNGQNIWPLTVLDAIKTPAYMGGDLGKALNQLSRAVLYNQNQIAKYAEVNINLANVSVGDEVNLPYNGVMVPHIVLHIGNPDAEMYDASCDGVWLLRKDCVEQGQWNSSNVNTLHNSNIMSTMQGYGANYDSAVQAAIQTVKIPYCVGGGNNTVRALDIGLECKIFPLSGYEVGFSIDAISNIPIDGSVLSYFQGTTTSTADPKRVAYYDGTAISWWLRTPNINYSNRAYSVAASGAYSGYDCTTSYGIRPCFIMPTTFTATYFVDENGNVHPNQEYISDGSYEDILGDTIPVPKIETGSYVGTGTISSSYPNTLKAQFDISLVFISGNPNGDYSFACIGSKSGLMQLGGPGSGVISDEGTIQSSISGNTISWYSGNASRQMNVSGATYDYVILGK